MPTQTERVPLRRSAFYYSTNKLSLPKIELPKSRRDENRCYAWVLGLKTQALYLCR